jgi:hypothetical protein
MSGKDAKQFVYRYNGDVKSEEVEQDLDGEGAIPVKDQIIQRNGKSWRVIHVTTEVSTRKGGPIPVIRVFLMGQA